MDELLVQAEEQLHKLLYDDGSETGYLLRSVEEATGMAREHFVYGAIGIIAVYLIVGKQAQLLSNTICFVIPTIIAYHTLRANDYRKYRQLIVYWTANAAIGIVDVAYMASDQHRFSLYWLVKTALLLLLLMFPDGPQRIYDYFMASTLEAMESVSIVQQPQIADDVRPTESIEPELINIVETTQMNEPPPLPEVVIEKKEQEKASIVKEEPPSSEQSGTEEERLKAKEAEEIKPNIEKEARNGIRPRNQPGIQQLLKKALHVVASITPSSTPAVTAESAVHESLGTGVDEHREDETGTGTDDQAHFHRNAPVRADISEEPSDSSKLLTDAELNISQSQPLETPEPHVPTLAEDIVEKEEQQKASIIEDEPPSPAQPVTEEKCPSAEETDKIHQLLDEAHYIVTSITHSSTPAVTTESAVEESLGTGVDELQKDETSAGTHDQAHFEQNAPVSADISEEPSDSSKLLTDAESNVSQSQPLETPESHVPTLAEDVAVDQPSTTLDSETSPPVALRDAHDSLNDSTSDSHQTTTTSLNQQPMDPSEPPLEDDDLWMEPSGTLVFNAPFHEETLTYPVRLTNTSKEPIGFNIKSNALPRLSSDRAFGVLATGESVQLAVSCAPFVHDVEDMSKDCITIEYMTVPVDVHNFGLDWFLNKNGDCTIKRKDLFVQYNA